MAEGLEPYHVPQQSRRDNLRVVAQNQPTTPLTLSGLLPSYDPSFFSSDLLTCASGIHEFHHPYLDPQSLLPLNPSTVQDMNNNPFLYSTTQHHQSLRDFDNSYDNNSNGCGGGGDVVVYKPEPLSLSLSNSHYTQHNNLPLESAMIYSGKVTATGYMVPSNSITNGASCSTSNEVSRCSVPLGPFTGYASILKRSRFFRPAQQMLEELCDARKVIFNTEKNSPMEPPPQNLSDAGGGCSDSGSKNPRLISILDEVYRRYKQCYQQMQAVVASFECVAGLGNAAPYANLAMKAMSKQFRYLKNVITEQLQFNKVHGHVSPIKIECPRFGSSDESLYNRPVQNSGFLQNQPVWRPQRGLPECAVTVLRAWLFEHFLHPYPTDTDKVMLAKLTGLSRNQVSNWFINARVRLWKPMVEELHMLDTRQARRASQNEERNANKLSDHLASAENVSMSTQRVEGNNTPSKRTRSELPDVEPPNLTYNCFSSHPRDGGNAAGVYLALGLHQNNGLGLPGPFPINAAQRFSSTSQD